MLFAQAMETSRKKRLPIGDRGVYPTMGTVTLIKDLIVMNIGPLECSVERPDGIALNCAPETNDLLGDDTH